MYYLHQQYLSELTRLNRQLHEYVDNEGNDCCVEGVSERYQLLNTTVV